MSEEIEKLVDLIDVEMGRRMHMQGTTPVRDTVSEGESEQDTGELATGGVIEPGGIALVADGAGSPEIIHFPAQPTVTPNTLPDNGVKITYTNNGWPANFTAMPNPTLGATAGTSMYVGDVPWQYWPPAIPSQYVPPVTITPTIGTSTEPLTPERIEELMRKQPIRVAPAPVQLTDEIRAFIREEVHRTIYPTAEMVNPHVHRRIEMTEESGKKWRGVLYLVEKESEM